MINFTDIFWFLVITSNLIVLAMQLTVRVGKRLAPGVQQLTLWSTHE